MKYFSTVLSYLGVGVLGLVSAYIVSSQLIPSAQTQEPPPPPPQAQGQMPSEPVPPPPPAEPAAPNNQGPVQDFTFLEPFVYDSQEGRRDPFKPTSTSIGGGNVGPEATVLLPPQRFDLKDFKLVGVLWDVKNPKAMFLDPNGTMHVIGVDDRIGRNNGYIAVIREGEVVVVEAQRVRGEILYTTKILRITSK